MFDSDNHKLSKVLLGCELSLQEWYVDQQDVESDSGERKTRQKPPPVALTHRPDRGKTPEMARRLRSGGSPRHKNVLSTKRSVHAMSAPSPPQFARVDGSGNKFGAN